MDDGWRNFFKDFLDPPREEAEKRAGEHLQSGGWQAVACVVIVGLAVLIALAAIDKAGLTPDWILERCKPNGGRYC